MFLKRLIRGTVFAAIAVLATMARGVAQADPIVTFNKLLEEVKFSGDFRLRQENFDNPHGTPDRNRQRMRLRLATDFRFPNALTIKTRLTTDEPFSASDGSLGGDPISGNQTFTNNSSKKSIWVDLAYVEWMPGNAKFMAGKSVLGLWTQESSDVLWDPDYTPEGLSEGWTGLVGPLGVFANAGQYVTMERSASTRDVYDLSEQLGAEMKLPAETRLKFSAAHHEYVNFSSPTAVNDIVAGNTAGSRFSILEFTGAFNFWLFNQQVSLQTTWAQNLAAKKTTMGIAGRTPDEEDTAIQAGVVVGGTAAKQFQVAGFYKEIENDAVIRGITDSDFPNTTNAKGWIGWVSYAFNDYINVKSKYFDSKKKVVAPGADPSNIKRLQLDLNFKF